MLSVRDRIKVNAAFLILREAGADTSAITRMATAGANIGTPAKAAYAQAFDMFAASNPAFHAPLMRLGQLVDAADDRTVAGYGHALDRHGQSGDRAALEAIMPTLQADMAAMAARTGDTAFADGLTGSAAPASPAPGRPPAATPHSGEGPPSGRDMPGWGPMGYTPSRDTSRQPGQPQQAN